MIYRILYLSIWIFFTGNITGQSPAIPENMPAYDIVDRLEILYGSDIFTSVRNFRRHRVFNFAQTQYLYNDHLTKLEDQDLQYLFRENNEWITTERKHTAIDEQRYVDSTQTFFTLESKKIEGKSIVKETRDPWLKHFYKTPANFWEVETENFSLKVNPVIHFHAGKEENTGDLIFQNTRGINIRAYIDDKFYIFTNVLENQARFINYHENRIRRFSTIPGNGLYKRYDDKLIVNLKGWDFLNAQAYVGAQISESINIEFGHGRHFIGNGIRSLLLSDWSNNYFYLKFNTQIWKFHYQNIFAELAPISNRLNPGDFLLPKKYTVNHFLDFKLSDCFSIGLFETVVFSRENQFELQYLNPVILYRVVEQFLDSPDNVLLGLNSKYNIRNRAQIYGQLVLDEFRFSEATGGNGWWANKYGYQLGVKYLNLGGIDHLDVQVELNTVKPYTYTHRDTLSINNNYALASYSHYSQPLAHPLGANFREVIFKLTYRPSIRWQFSGRWIMASQGDDTATENWGGNILTPNTTRLMDYGNELLQGEKTDISLLGLDVSYQIFHNYFLDLNLLYRKSDSNLVTNDVDTKYIGAGLRMNIGRRVLDY